MRTFKQVLMHSVDLTKNYTSNNIDIKDSNNDVNDTNNEKLKQQQLKQQHQRQQQKQQLRPRQQQQEQQQHQKHQSLISRTEIETSKAFRRPLIFALVIFFCLTK